MQISAQLAASLSKREVVWIVGLVMGGIAYGALLTLSIMTLVALFRARKIAIRNAEKRLALQYQILQLHIVLVTGLNTFLQVWNLIHYSREIVYTEKSQLTYFYRDWSTIVTVLLAALTDGLLVWKCYAVQNALSNAALSTDRPSGTSNICWIFPLLLWFAQTGVGTACVALFDPETPIEIKTPIDQSMKLFIAGFSLAILLSFSATANIVIRLLLHRRYLISALGESTRYPLLVSRILIESAALNVPITLILVVSTGLREFYGPMITQILNPCQAIASILVIYQVGRRRTASQYWSENDHVIDYWCTFFDISSWVDSGGWPDHNYCSSQSLTLPHGLRLITNLWDDLAQCASDGRGCGVARAVDERHFSDTSRPRFHGKERYWQIGPMTAQIGGLLSLDILVLCDSLTSLLVRHYASSIELPSGNFIYHPLSQSRILLVNEALKMIRQCRQLVYLRVSCGDPPYVDTEFDDAPPYLPITPLEPSRLHRFEFRGSERRSGGGRRQKAIIDKRACAILKLFGFLRRLATNTVHFGIDLGLELVSGASPSHAIPTRQFENHILCRHWKFHFLDLYPCKPVAEAGQGSDYPLQPPSTPPTEWIAISYEEVDGRIAMASGRHGRQESEVVRT
ncbi:hypothetical protein NP233_g266 [Leucocoprinus birnbaumii]|uniref:Uncharacterized protein n=1 Tax=Leucocoprinus birnbaumii TaxID=56174 RepID=A0AAD5W4H8_9AGAR|nr:hypothetical protein NP233_g266 [Leucocoprinus birnbaumii]